MKSFLSIAPAMAWLCASVGLHAQTLSVDKPTVNLVAQAGGSPATTTLNISTSSGNPSFFVLSNASWLTVAPSTGTAPSAITISGDPLHPSALAAGTYQGTLQIIGPNNTVNVQVSLTVGNIGVDKTSLQFSYQMQGTLPAAQTINLTGNATTYTASFSPGSGGNWAIIAPTSGTSPGAITVSPNPQVVPTLAAGTYTGTITITPTSGSITSSIPVTVTLTVTPSPPVTVTPSTVSLFYQIGGTNNSASQNIVLSTTGSQGVSFGFTSTVNPNPANRVWFNFTPSNGTIPANGNTTVTVSYDSTANLPAGTWTGTLTLFTPGGNPAQQNIPVQLLVSTQPLISVSPASLTYNYQVNGATPAAQNVTVTSTSGSLPFSISATTTTGGPWLSVPSGGISGNATPFAVSVNPAGLATGTYNGTVTVTASGAANGSVQIPVTLKVANDPLLTLSANGCSLPAFQSCSLTFASQTGQAQPPVQSIKISSTTGAQLSYTVTSSATSCGGNWLQFFSPTTGNTDTNLLVGVNTTGVPANTQCAGTISVAATNPSTNAATPNSPVQIPVTLFTSSTPLLVVNPSAITFTGQVSGSAPPTQAITVASTSATDQLNYTVSFNAQPAGWLLVSMFSGTTAPGSNVITLSAFPGLLSPGTYSGTVTITATGPGGAAVADSPVTIPVIFQVTASTMSVSPTNLAFTQTAGGAAPAAQPITVSSTNQAVSFTASTTVDAASGNVNWLSVTPATGTTPATLSVKADGSQLQPGTYHGTVTIISNTAGTGGSPATVQVTLTVNSGTISSDTTSLTFTQAAGGSAPASQPIKITGTPGNFNFTAAAAVTTPSGGNWLTVTPATGTTPATLQVSASAGSLPVGQYQGTITVTANGATGSPITIPVTLNVVTGQTLTTNPASLTFNYVLNTTPPQPATFVVNSTGGPAPFNLSAKTDNGGNWLSASPTSGTTQATITVSVNPASITTVGDYTGNVNITSPNAVQGIAVAVTLHVTSVPKPVIKTVNNAASYVLGGVSPGENIVIFGTGIGPSPLVSATFTNGALPTVVANTQVFFDNIAAPVIYASDGVTSAMVPYGVTGRPNTAIRVVYQGVSSDAVTYNVVAAAPGFYTQNASGTGPGWVRNADFSPNLSTNPAAINSVVSLVITGEGQTSPAGTDSLNGKLAPIDGTGLNHPILPVSVTIGGVPAQVTYQGTQPGNLYGVMQVNVQIPANAPIGDSDIIVTLGTGANSFSTQPGVKISVKAQ